MFIHFIIIKWINIIHRILIHIFTKKHLLLYFYMIVRKEIVNYLATMKRNRVSKKIGKNL